MTYAIIGAGAIGHAIATQFARNGIEVLVANRRGPVSLSEMVGALGRSISAASVQDALRADVVILAVPFPAIPEAVRGAPPWNGRVVVDASNAIDFPAFTPTDLGGRLSSEVVADAVPGARVVKAFNTVRAAILASDPAQNGGRRVIALSGNDDKANAVIGDLIEQLGFAALNLGNLSQGSRLQQLGGMLHDVNLIKLAV
jgi:8-hydroxy-5-deazaflavin:NADPH oxidoreductase